MGAVVVHDEMNVQLFWNIWIDVSEEFLKLLMAMFGFALRKDISWSDVKSSK